MKVAPVFLLAVALLVPFSTHADTLSQYNGSCDDNVNVGNGQGVGSGFLLPDSDTGYNLSGITVRGEKGTLGVCDSVTLYVYDGDYTSSASNLIATSTLACSSLASYSGAPSLNLTFPLDVDTTPNETDYFYKIISSGGVSNDGYRHCMDNTSPSNATVNAYWYSAGWTSWTTKDDNYIILGTELTESESTTTSTTTDSTTVTALGFSFVLFFSSFVYSMYVFRLSYL